MWQTHISSTSENQKQNYISYDCDETFNYLVDRLRTDDAGEIVGVE
jgi:hypothetical protein